MKNLLDKLADDLDYLPDFLADSILYMTYASLAIGVILYYVFDIRLTDVAEFEQAIMADWQPITFWLFSPFVVALILRLVLKQIDKEQKKREKANS